LTVARLIAEETNSTVTIYEKRDHIGGNAHSYFDSETEIEVHKYGSHLFHTSNDLVWNFVNRFAKFNDYKHTVWAKHNNEIFSLPFNLATINQFLRTSMSPQEAQIFMTRSTDEKSRIPSNLEEKAISLIGSELYEAFVKNYTQKQWQTDPKFLSPEIISRIPVRYTYNNHYFDDKYQGQPLLGYADLFNKMVDHKSIKVVLNHDYSPSLHSEKKRPLTIYTGAIDAYFDHMFGRLSWRTVDFEFEKIEIPDFQGAAVINYSDLESRWTRIHEFKHMHPERATKVQKTIIAREYSRFAVENDEPYYPVNTPEDRLKLAEYRRVAKEAKGVFFGGRLGSYQYLDMHMAIASAISLFRNEIQPILT
jgi:UDP-galactopyranose mutase